MKLKNIIIVFILACLTQVSYANCTDTPSISAGGPQAITAIWQLKEMYVNTTRVSDSTIANVNFVLNADLNVAYILKGDQAVQFNLSYIPDTDVKLLNPSNGAVMFSYKVMTLTDTVLILTAQTPDPQNPNVTHSQEYRFVRANTATQGNSTQ